MDEQQFQRALITILVGGGLLFGAGIVVLVVIFRRFQGSKSNVALMAGLLGFIFLACLVLFALSYAR